MSRIGRLAATALAVVLVAACTGSGDGASAGPSSTQNSGGQAQTAERPLVWAPCDAGFECSRLATTTGSSTGGVSLALTRHRAAGPGPRIGSLLVNPGGPGASAVDYLQSRWTALPAALAQRFDLVAFDPRGVGHSAPVRCATTEELDRFIALDPSPDSPLELTAYTRAAAGFTAGCRQRAGELLPQMSTETAADDLELIRRALGEDHLSYLGYSYGTALGAAYLDRYPTRVRAMVLDGAEDPTLTWSGFLTGQAEGFDRALTAFLANCQAIGCPFGKAKTGDLSAAFDALARQVDQHPLPAGGVRALGPGEMTLGVGAGLYNRAAGWPAIAAALTAAERGDGAGLLALSDSYLQRSARGYENIFEANLAVSCVDRPWPRDPAAYTALAATLARTAPRFGPAIALSALVCATWPVPATATPHPVHAPGSPPVVVIGTTADPATPYPWAVALAGQLARGVLITHVGDGHTIYRNGAPDCLTRPVTDYLVLAVAPPALRC